LSYGTYKALFQTWKQPAIHEYKNRGQATKGRERRRAIVFKIEWINREKILLRTKCVFFTKWLVLTQTQEAELMDSKHRQKPARNKITFNKPNNGRRNGR